MKKRSQAFIWSMILFYFFSTSLYNWFNGDAFYNLPFYVFVLVLAGVCLYWVISIIRSPHIVKKKETNAPAILFWIGLILSLSLFTTMIDVSDVLEAIYIFSFFASMAFLIYWYKSTGTVLSENKTVSITEEKLNENIPEIVVLKQSLKEALSVSTSGTDSYNYLTQAEMLVDEIINKHIEAPEQVVKQINKVIKSYVEVALTTIKTKKVYETKLEIEDTFPMIVQVLTNIYDSGMDERLTDIEVESETLKNLIELSGLKNSDFNLKKDE